MSKLTLDETIKHCLEVAEEQSRLYSLCPFPCYGTDNCMSLKNGKDMGCTKCAAEHRQLAEWLMELRARRLLMDKVCGELAELYGSPCQEPKAEDFMRKNGFCEDCKIIISDKECWFRYFQRKFNCARMDGEKND